MSEHDRLSREEDKNRILSRELKTVLDNLTATQRRCTELLEERRTLSSALKVIATETWGALHPADFYALARVGLQTVDICRKAGFDPESPEPW